MKIDEGKLLLLLSGILAGIFIAVLVVNTSVNPTKFLSYQEYENMSSDSNQLKIELRGINKEINELGKKLTKYQNSGGESKTITDTMKKELDDLQMFYGVSKVEGPGLQISINDRHKKVYKDYYDLTFSTVHDYDLLYVVNNLKNAGAEAISINNKRIISKTAITCEGPVIMVNGQYIVPPFVIKAIGDPDALNYALTTSADSRYKDLEIRKLELRIMKVNKLDIDGIDNIPESKYAKKSE